MSTYTHPVSRAIPEVVRHLAWFGSVCVVAFLVPYFGVSVLDLQHDLFYLIYFAATIALVAANRRGPGIIPSSIARLMDKSENPAPSVPRSRKTVKPAIRVLRM